MKYGFEDSAWEAAKNQGKAILAECARARKLLSYGEFINDISSIVFPAPNDPRLAHLLAEISIDEVQAGRGLMTAIVVRKNGDQMPGAGFYELAGRLGYDISDREKFWIDQVNQVFGTWQKA